MHLKTWCIVVAAKRAELEEQKRQMLEQQRQVRELEMEQIVEQGQIESVCDVQVGDNLVEKLQAAVLVRDGVIEAIEGAARTGKIGDGKVFVYNLEQVVRIRTGETGREAL